MPTYDYRCEKCLTAFAVSASVSEYEAGLNVQCPVCGSKRVRRSITAVNILAGPRGSVPQSGGCCGGPGGNPGCCGG